MSQSCLRRWTILSSKRDIMLLLGTWVNRYGSAFFAECHIISVGFQEGMAPRLIKVMRHHFVDHLIKRDLRYPSEICFCFRRVTEQGFNFCRSEVTGVDADNRFVGGEGRDGLPRRFAPRNDGGGRARNDRGGRARNGCGVPGSS